MAPTSEPLLRVAVLSELAIVLTELGNPDEGLRLAEEALSAIEFHGLGSDPRVSLYTLAHGSAALSALGELKLAAEALERSLEFRGSGGALNQMINPPSVPGSRARSVRARRSDGRAVRMTRGRTA